MSLDAPVATVDLLSVQLLVSSIGKALVKKGSLDKQDLIAELTSLVSVLPPEMKINVERTIESVKKW
ncbi:hypothetical protein [Agrobacterium pusense]|jgi:hypothetical protein|uniref:hypothetical protein n=1 Tax=Agrobacterium pusense TaxID=648995 RepID=UPI0022B92C95|nr:hypothetical protein [Agrobacterium pusense]MCZ7926165.1 hypothetical protein [Agrobacterium pusense]